ncbi:COG1361 S-layer family protein [Candidatus Nanohalococcus occultus]|uniref:COG1361 S-layer family protein n=1 Tax=Candidatus Nanohalococcus occultus TaxID=2978047 RepID=UPI0039E0E478
MNNKQLFVLGITAIMLANPAIAQTQQTSSGATVNLDTVLLNTDPVPVQSGEDAQVTFKVVHRGSVEAQDVQVTVQDSFPFELEPDEQRTYDLGTVTPGEEYYITTNVLVADNAPDGESNLQAEIQTQSDVSITRDVPVNVQSSDVDLSLANLQTSPATLMPDTEDNQMTVELVNQGEKTAENVVLNLDFPDVFEERSSFSSRQSLGNLPAGETKSATFNFDISENATSGEIEVPGAVSYSTGDDAGTIEKEVSFSTYLEGKPQYEVVSMSSDLTVAGSGTITAEIENTGSVESSSTRIRLLDNSDLPFSFDSSSEYIGTLEPGQTGTAVFQVDTESGATAKDYLLDFELRGTHGTEVFVEDTTLQVDVSASSSSSSGIPLQYAGLGVLIVLGGAAFLFRERLGL